MKRTLGVPYVNTDYQAFARWPDFLNAYWAALKPALSSPLYGESKHALRESAMSCASELPNAPQFSEDLLQQVELTSDEVDTAIRITEEFLDTLSGLLLNIAFAKISLEGGTRAGASFKWQEKPPALDQPERAA
jgi:hypothetical protein